MIEISVLTVFIPTFFLVSLTPGMCMTLALTMGMTIGVKKTFYMMWGELAGVAIVSAAAALGVAAVMLNYPGLFTVLKYTGGAYLIFLGLQMIQAKGKMAVTRDNSRLHDVSEKKLALQGFITAIANPKGWAFMISLLPPFISPDKPFAPQLFILVSIILTTEFICLVLYSSGGHTLSRFLEQGGNVRMLNKISGMLMIGIGIWLATG